MKKKRLKWGEDYIIALVKRLGEISAHAAITIMARTAKKHRVCVEDLVGPSRSQRLIYARAETYANLRDAGYSLEEIGFLVGNRDHANVHHAMKSHYEREKAARDAIRPYTRKWASGKEDQ